MICALSDAFIWHSQCESRLYSGTIGPEVKIQDAVGTVCFLKLDRYIFSVALD